MVFSEQLAAWDSPTHVSSSMRRRQQDRHQALSSFLYPAYPSALSSTSKVLSPPESVFAANEHCPASFSFKTKFPSHYTDERGERMPLPPSFSDKLTSIPGFRVDVNYAIIVAITRLREQKPKQKANLGLSLPWKSKRKNVLLETPVEYIPRSKPSRPFPFSLNSNPTGWTPQMCFLGVIESRDVCTQPLKTQVSERSHLFVFVSPETK